MWHADGIPAVIYSFPLFFICLHKISIFFIFTEPIHTQIFTNAYKDVENSNYMCIYIFIHVWSNVVFYN